MKKFLTVLLMGAFLFVSMAAVTGCGEEKKKEEPKKVEEKKAT